jgi:hypothetical protein
LPPPLLVRFIDETSPHGTLVCADRLVPVRRGCESTAAGREFTAAACESTAAGCEFTAAGCEFTTNGCESTVSRCEFTAALLETPTGLGAALRESAARGDVRVMTLLIQAGVSVHGCDAMQV